MDYLQKERTENGEYYANPLGRFNKDLKKKRTDLVKRVQRFYKRVVVIATYNDLGFKLLSLRILTGNRFVTPRQ